MRNTLSVLVLADSYDLTRADTVKAELGISGSSEDANIAAWIGQASSAIAAYCNRTLAMETVSETFRFELCEPRADCLLLSRYPVQNIVSITEDGTALTSDDFEVDPDTGELFRLSSDYPRDWCGRTIVVQYVGGYELLPDLPQAIERACINLVKTYRAAAARDPLVRSETVDGVLSQTFWVGTVPGSSGGIPPDVTAMLDPFVRYDR